MHLEDDDGNAILYEKMYITEDITYIFHDHRYLNIISSKKLYSFEAISSCCHCSFSISVSITLSVLWDVFPSIL